jgi:hypothetical protein
MLIIDEILQKEREREAKIREMKESMERRAIGSYNS